MKQSEAEDHEDSAVQCVDHIRRILDRRAVELARSSDQNSIQHDTIEVLSVRIAEEHYAIETRYIREVVRVSKLTPVPETPAFIAGVTNLRGDVLAVMDLGELLGCPVRDPSAWIVTLGRDVVEFGVLVDRVEEVGAVESRSIRAQSHSLRALSQPFVRGVTPDATIVLDGRLLLQDERLFIDDET